VEKISRPNLFLVGSPKCGTSFLWKKLKEHKEIFCPNFPQKELNFFSSENLNKESYYNSYAIKSISNYLDKFKGSKNQKYLFDGSVSYFIYNDVPKKIYDFNPNAKIIIMYRDPIKRAISHYNMDRRMGLAKKKLSYYLTEPKEEKFYRQYVDNSMFLKNYLNFKKFFNDDQILILNFDEPNNISSKLSKFLKIELDENFFDFSQKFNYNKVPSNFISKFLHSNRYISTILKKYVPSTIIKKFSPYMYSNSVKVLHDENDIEILKELIKSDWKKFKKIIT